MHTHASRSQSAESTHQPAPQTQSPGWGEPQNQPQSDRTPPAVHDFSHVDLFSHAPQNRPPVQMKLTVGEPSDQYEQEADRVADQVLSKPDPATPPVQREETSEEELQTKPASGATPSVEPLEDDEIQMKPAEQSLNINTGIQQNSEAMLLQRLDLPEIAQSNSSDVVQRVKTPKLPATEWNSLSEWFSKGTDSGKLGQGIDDDQVYRNYLLVMKWQLATNASPTNPLVAEVNNLLDQKTPLNRAEVEKLIGKVNNATPNATSSTPEKPERLNSQEEKDFDVKMNMACTKLDATVTHKDAVETTFQGKETSSKQDAINGYTSIRSHLKQWQKDVKTHVQINRADKAGYSAFNLGSGANSKLMLSDDFFKEDDLSLAGTLIHEASHGILGTTDLAYMSAPYFSKLKDSLALKNADHYAHAVHVAEGKGSTVTVSGAKTEFLQKFQQALSLCFYRCSKVWYILMLLNDRYGGTNRNVSKDTKKSHEQLMQLGGETDDNYKGKLADICKERTVMFKEVMNLMKGYTNTPKTFTETPNSIKMLPLDKQWPEIEIPAQSTDSIETLSKQIFVHTLKDFKFSDAQANDMYNWEEGLFADMIKDQDNKNKYNISKEDEELHNLLKA